MALVPGFPEFPEPHGRQGHDLPPRSRRMALRQRIERAKQLTVFGAKTGALVVGVAVTVGVLGLLWRMLHDAEDEALLAMFPELAAAE